MAASSEGDGLFFVAECYYDSKGKPELCSTMEHNNVSGGTVAETKETYEQMAEAFKAPVIELDSEGNFKDGTQTTPPKPKAS